jgi:Flp pilus assembly protein TadD
MDSKTARRGRMAALVAAASLVAACAQEAGNSASSLRVAERAAQGGDHETAATLYRQAFDADPRSIEALVGLGQSYGAMGQTARAEQALLEAANRRPNDPTILLALARVQLAGGKPQSALANLERAGARAPNDLAVVAAHGVALDRLSRHAEAQDAYRGGLQRDPTNFALLSNLGLSLGLSGKGDEGIVILRDLVRDPSATAQTRGNLALVYGLTGREREARAILAQDLPASEINANIVYYRELRQLLAQGRAIGGLQ